MSDTNTTQGTPTTVSGKENTYFFKTPILKDEDGKEVGKGTKHPDVKVLIPAPTAEEVIVYLSAPDGTEDAKVRDMILDALFDQQVAAGRKQINEFLDANPDKQFAATDMDISKLSLLEIAKMPKGQRGAYSPSDEEFKAFNESYTEVLVQKTNYDPKKTKTHTEHWKTGMAKVKGTKPVVAKLRDFLLVYAANVDEEEMEENSQVYAWLLARADKYLAAQEKDFLQAL